MITRTNLFELQRIILSIQLMHLVFNEKQFINKMWLNFTEFKGFQTLKYSTSFPWQQK